MVKKVLKTFEIDYLQVLDEHGKVDESLMPKVTDDDLKKLYENMILVRTFDKKAFSLQRQGRIGTYLEVRGQEASQVGSTYAMKDKDWLFPMYRSTGALIVRGQPMTRMLQYWGGDERGLISPDEFNNFPIAIPVGTQALHALGAGWASKLTGDGLVSVVYLGDGATSKEDFMSAMNFAGVYNAATVFIVENNQFAISTHRDEQTGSETIAQKAIAFGFEGIQVDGNDVLAVYKVTKDAVDKARRGDGPTLIECYTYRMGDHSTSDDAARYRDQKEVEEWAKKDPIDRMEKFMTEKGLLDDTYKDKVQADSTAAVKEAIDAYEKVEPANPEDIFTYMYAEMPTQLKEQFEEYKESKK
ncbi:MAG: pyruvate dehydrogenase (acetyl-transferring) E1 component subunit alpha [Nanoarchaeota archaeon]|nr:pyruvate dehydrogenase (acetyl-transferring) E1 component subunit alpha [Nanoarchaeota archaeon]